MILVDTSVWIDHLKSADRAMLDYLDRGRVLVHHFVIGELACGTLPARDRNLSRLQGLTHIRIEDHETVMSLIVGRKLHGRGVGFIDAHLLASVVAHPGTTLWTRDRRLHRVADELEVAHTEPHHGPNRGIGGGD